MTPYSADMPSSASDAFHSGLTGSTAVSDAQSKHVFSDKEDVEAVPTLLRDVMCARGMCVLWSCAQICQCMRQ